MYQVNIFITSLLLLISWLNDRMLFIEAYRFIKVNQTERFTLTPSVLLVNCDRNRISLLTQK